MTESNTATNDRPIRVLVGKPGLDGHDVGAKVLCRALMDAGMEVIYTGLRQSPAAIARAAADEDVDVVALSIMSGAHIPLCEMYRKEAEQAEIADALWMVGGNIPRRDHDALKAIGVQGIFPTGSRFDAVVSFIEEGVTR